jgi:hypothetical protein
MKLLSQKVIEDGVSDEMVKETMQAKKGLLE